MEEKEMRGEVERRKENQGPQGTRMITVLPVAPSWALSQPAVFLVQEGIPVHSSGNAAARFHGCSRACVNIPNKDASSLLHSANLCCVASLSFCWVLLGGSWGHKGRQITSWDPYHQRPPASIESNGGASHVDRCWDSAVGRCPGMDVHRPPCWSLGQEDAQYLPRRGISREETV